ncbi:transporter [Thiolapillus sp.]
MNTREGWLVAGHGFLHVMAFLLMSSTISAAPITFNTALAVGKGEYVLREQFVVVQSGHDPAGLNRDRRETAVVTALGYGLSGKWALFAAFPYRNIDLDLDREEQAISRQASGLGDLSLFARYTAYQHDAAGKTLRIAPFAGLKTPTGTHRKKDRYGLLAPSVQIGSGSWDPFAGVVLTYQTLQYQFDAQFSYRMNTEADGFEAGDIARLDGSLQYRLHPHKLSAGTPGFLYGVLEMNLIHQRKNKLNGSSDPDTGGTRLFLTPGIQYITRRWIIEGAVQLPVVQNLNGRTLKNDYILRTGFRINF